MPVKHFMSFDEFFMRCSDGIQVRLMGGRVRFCDFFQGEKATMAKQGEAKKDGGGAQVRTRKRKRERERGRERKEKGRRRGRERGI